MELVRDWTAKRAGGRITVTHSTGKIVGVDSIAVRSGKIVATDRTGKHYALDVPAGNYQPGVLIHK